MQTAKITFEFTETKNFEALSDSVNYLLGTWRKNGQILGKQFLMAKTENSFDVFVNIPDFDSLAEKFNNKYVAENLSDIDGLKVVRKVTILGEEPESKHVCGCKRVKGYILFTNYLTLESPLKCFDCFGVVPLYKVPKTKDEEYINILSWESDYQSCDSLQMNCRVGERFGTEQISKHDSPLSKIGLEICGKIETATGKKVYYYLYKYRAKSYETEQARKCPNCKGDWLLPESLHNIFDFKCDNCRLLSNIAWDVRH
jgi:predicted  nucleic acid-binding Zn ribbon protein